MSSPEKPSKIFESIGPTMSKICRRIATQTKTRNGGSPMKLGSPWAPAAKLLRAPTRPTCLSEASCSSAPSQPSVTMQSSLSTMMNFEVPIAMPALTPFEKLLFSSRWTTVWPSAFIFSNQAFVFSSFEALSTMMIRTGFLVKFSTD